MGMAAGVSDRFSMRQLRSSISSAAIDAGDRKGKVSNQSTKSAASFTNYTAAPKQRLQLVEVQLGSVAKAKDWSRGIESNKERKRRRWKEIQKRREEKRREEKRRE